VGTLPKPEKGHSQFIGNLVQYEHSHKQLLVYSDSAKVRYAHLE